MAKSRRDLLLRKKFILNWLYLRNKRKFTYRKKRWWVHPILMNRKKEGYFETMMVCMKKHDPLKFGNFTRMSPEKFEQLLSLVSNCLQKYTLARPALSTAHRLAVTLRFLATGESLQSIAYGFRLGVTTCHNIVKETCQVLWDVLQPLYMPTPTVEKWKKVARSFESSWNFPMCCGAVDGKHVAVQQPAKSGTLYHNYKGFNSIVLMAVVDANYRFLTVDVGAYGSHSDGGIFKTSKFGQDVQTGKVDFPDDSYLPNTDIKVPHVLLGDEAFQLLPNFMRPFPGQGLDTKRRVFNYRLSRARRCSENAFGILASRWRVYRRPLLFKPENVDRIVKATVVLHNFLMMEDSEKRMENIEEENQYCPKTHADYIDAAGNTHSGQWHEILEANPARGLLDMPATSARNYSNQAADVRMAFANYFVTQQGETPWQWDLLRLKRPV